MVELCNFKKIVFELEVYGELHYKSASIFATGQNYKLDSSFCKYQDVFHEVS